MANLRVCHYGKYACSTGNIFAALLETIYQVQSVEYRCCNSHVCWLNDSYSLALLNGTCQGFTSRTPARVQDGSLPKGLNEYPAQLPRLGQLRTHVGSKSLVMQDYKQLPQLITTLEYFGNLQREMSQVATQTFNVLYCFPFIWFNGSHYPRSYI